MGDAQEVVDTIAPLPAGSPLASHTVVTWDEYDAKAALASYGLRVPAAEVTDDVDALPGLASRLGYPVVLKALSVGLAHKSDVGGVVVGLDSDDAVRRAAAAMTRIADRFLVERMVPGALAELLVGVQRDPRLGLGLTVGAGGVLVELVDEEIPEALVCRRHEPRSGRPSPACGSDPCSPATGAGSRIWLRPSMPSRRSRPSPPTMPTS